MNAAVQTLLALAIVAGTAAAFAWRAVIRRRRPGCGGSCGCPTDAFKAKLKP